MDIQVLQVQHFSHDHPLTLADKVDLFAPCSACGDLASRRTTTTKTAAAAAYYRCPDPSCWFYLHKSCLDLPRELTGHPFHPEHPLSLLPHAEFLCGACGKSRRGFAFRCSDVDCDFYLDVHCASLVVVAPTSETSEDVIAGHVGQSHPLIVCNKDKDFGISCSACELPFQDSVPIYVCLECKLLLHKHCAQLPPKIHHPFHPHHPLLLFTRIPDGERFTKCKACWKDFQSGFTYRCTEDGCDFILGTGCAFIMPRNFDFHEHPLSLFERIRFNCTRCHCRKCSGVLRCVMCGFGVHLHCFPGLPETVRKERWHRHTLKLTKVPVKDYEDEGEDAEFYCDKCEKLRLLPDPTYSCEQCHYVAHVRCMVSTEEMLSQGEECSAVDVAQFGELDVESSSEMVREVMNKQSMEVKKRALIHDKEGFNSLEELDTEIRSLSAQLVALTAKIEALKHKRALFIFR